MFSSPRGPESLPADCVQQYLKTPVWAMIPCRSRILPSHPATMQALSPVPAASLQQLHPDVLRLIIERLQRETHGRAPADVQALRCTCRALRDVILPFISSLRIDAWEADSDAAAEPALAQLARFPAAAVLRKLSWLSRYKAADEYDDMQQLYGVPPASHPSHGQLPMFLSLSGSRLSSLTGIDLMCDVSALVGTEV